jgi:hypothetical protein
LNGAAGIISVRLKSISVFVNRGIVKIQTPNRDPLKRSGLPWSRECSGGKRYGIERKKER